jgi:hypothetical protein
MFISTNEKNLLKLFLTKAQSDILELKVLVQDLQTQLQGMKKTKKQKTPEQKARQAEYMKAYNARKREEKAAQKGNANVSS